MTNNALSAASFQLNEAGLDLIARVGFSCALAFDPCLRDSGLGLPRWGGLDT
jgi:hypothetical protein